MQTYNFLGILLSLLSAGTWGGGDFLGGLSTRKFNQYAVLVVSAFAGILVLILCSILWPEPFPKFPMFLWAALAGSFGVLGLSALYKGLSLGHSATIAPTAAVIGAAIPVSYGIFLDGVPDNFKIIGFILALIGIFLVSRPDGESNKITTTSMLLAITAGIGFGGFFIFITLAGPNLVFTPLIISRTTFFAVTSIILWINKGKIGNAISSPTVWLTGLFDSGGNALYMLAKQFTRVDVAVILSSLYPAATVLLSRIFLKERISRLQWLGVVFCLTAIIMISA